MFEELFTYIKQQMIPSINAVNSDKLSITLETTPKLPPYKIIKSHK
jgi:hypothetical protein